MRATYLIDKMWKRGQKVYIRYRFTSEPLEGRTFTESYTKDEARESRAKGDKDDRARGNQKA